MDSIYRSLFKLQYFHEFYKNKDDQYTHLDEDIKIVPTQQCMREMQNQGLLFRSTPGVFSVLFQAYKEDNQVQPLVPLTEPRKFSFQVFSLNPYIVHYSALPLEGKEQGIYYLSNLQNNIQNRDGIDELLLVKDTLDPYLSSLDEIRLKPSRFIYSFKHVGDTATLSLLDHQSNTVYSEILDKLDDGATTPEKNFSTALDLSALGTGVYTLRIGTQDIEVFYLDDALVGKKPFGLIDIYYHPDVPADYQFADAQGVVSSKTYTLRFNHRETVWKYLVGLKYRHDIDPQDLEIVSDVFPATFTRHSSFKLADNTTVIPFDSGSTTLPLKKEPVKGIKLKRTIAGHGSGSGSGGGSTEETPLPNPQISNIKTGSGKVYSEVYFYV